MNSYDRELIYTLRCAEGTLLQVLLTEFSLRASGGSLILDVQFSSTTPAIRRREAKALVRPEEAKVPGVQASLDRITDGAQYVHNDPEFAFRYSNGGVLPIVRLANRPYYCLFYRDTDPVGWNIANGASDSLVELLKPKLTIAREFREELIVVNNHADPPYFYDLAVPGSDDIRVAEYYRARHLTSRFLATNPRLSGEPLEVKWEDSDLDVLNVRYKSEVVTPHSGFYVNITARDAGIEFDKVAWIDLPPGSVLQDGELRDYGLLNRPIGLFDVPTLEASITAGNCEFLPDRMFWSCREIDPHGADPSLPAPFIGGRLSAAAAGGGNRGQSRLDLCPIARSIIQRRSRPQHIAAAITAMLAGGHQKPPDGMGALIAQIQALQAEIRALRGPAPPVMRTRVENLVIGVLGNVAAVPVIEGLKWLVPRMLGL